MRIMQPETKHKRELLLKAIAKTVKELRQKTGKSISLISNELNVSKSIWSDVELGKSDLQFTTFWRISEALEIQPEELIIHIKRNLADNISFIE
ncbi:MAG: helix-turn-helix transcriptional regulator [Brachyspira sp.]|nr:helix-turn-helix transcriptional regulator [Brachyspira sp.]